MNYPYKVNGYVKPSELWRLRALMAREQCGEALIVRDAINRLLDEKAVPEPTPDDVAALEAELDGRKRIPGKKKVEGQ